MREFLADLENQGELLRISQPVSPILEITEVADRHAKQEASRKSETASGFDPAHVHLGGKALLFENVTGCVLPLAINLYGSYHRMEMALGCDNSGGFESISHRISNLLQMQPPGSWRDMVHRLRQVLPLLRMTPRRVKRGVCQEVVQLTKHGEVDLTRLPLIKCWPFDGDPRQCGINVSLEQAGTARGEGRYVTFAGIHTIHARDAEASKPASHNVGMYRAQLIDETHLVMHWHIHHDGAAHWRSWKEIGHPMPIAICFGGEAVLPYAASAPLPPGMSELLLAGFIQKKGIPLVRAKTVPLHVPANSEIVIEGYVSTECGDIGYDPASGEPLGPGAAFEGPFGDHTGFYSLPDRYPVVEVTAVTHRRDAVFPATIVGLPPQEDYYLGKATERIFLPLLKTLIPDIVDYHLPMFGCFHNCVFVSVKKAYPFHARRVMYSIWGAGQMAWTKIIVVVDDDVNVHDEEAVLQRMFEQCHFQRDIELAHGPLDILDHSAPYLAAGQKIGFDATHKCTGENVWGIDVELKPEIPGVESTREALSSLTGQNGIVGISVPDFGQGRLVLISIDKSLITGQDAAQKVWGGGADVGGCVVIVDEYVDVQKWEDVFFHLGANADPGRDMIRHEHRICFDATKKLPGVTAEGFAVRDYPPILMMDEEVKKRIDSRKPEFGLV